MSSNDYWNNRPSGSQQGHNQQQGYDYQQQQSGRGQDGYPSPYGQQQQQSYSSYQSTSHHQSTEQSGWGYGDGAQQQNQSHYPANDQGRYQSQQYSSYDQGQPYNSYNDRAHSPRPPAYDPYSSTHNAYPDQGFSSHGAAGQVGPEGERGLLGALAGGAAGGFAGHKMNHGVIGAVGGAFAGHKLEDHYKDKKKEKEKKQGQSDRPPAPAALAGNFSASSTQISLDRDFDLIASCATTNGTTRLSSIDLNDCLTNSWGSLQWARGGGFGASARNVRLVDGGRVLEAELGDGKGGWKLSRVRLDERITNNDGDLQFMD